MAEKLNFPLTFPKCINCGSERKVAATVAKGEEEKGKRTPGLPAGTDPSPRMVPIFDPTKTILMAPTLIIFRDICADCGHEDVSYVACYDMGIELVRAGLPPGTKMPPGMPHR